MKKMTFKQKALKTVAVYLALSLLAEIAAPTMAYALTGGPSQPEVESFEPVGTTQMVDPFTGDFNYNIPLLTVPGPNGGYPLNLAYHAGVAMEQEASWVGLGWNVNVGEINRSMRGLPDEFSGEKIKKTLYHKPSWTIGGDVYPSQVSLMSTEKEVVGADFGISGSKPTIYYNNYKGLGLTWNMMKLTWLRSKMGSLNNIKTSLEFTFDSQSGIGVNPELSFHSKILKKEREFEIGGGYHSRDGWQGLEMKATTEEHHGDHHEGEETSDPTDMLKTVNQLNSTTRGAGAGFSSSSYMPGIPTSMFSTNSDFKMRFGRTQPSPLIATFDYKNMHVLTSTSHIKHVDKEVSAYGYMNLQTRVSGYADDKDAIMDFNREKEFPVIGHVPMLPLPVLTNDVYMVKGQGIGSVFRPFRSDIGVLYDPKKSSENIGAQLGLEQGVNTANNHWGVNAALSYADSYSGQWKNNWNDLETNYQFANTDETFYFKATGEMTAADDTYNETDRYGYEKPVNFRIEQRLDGGKVFNKQVDNGSAVLGNQARAKREPRSQHIEYRTRTEMNQNNQFHSGIHLFDVNDFPEYNPQGSNYPDPENTTATAINYAPTTNQPGGHLGSISMRNPDGNLYVYGLPVYNNKEREVVFSVSDDGSSTPEDHTTQKTVGYTAAEASKDNRSGEDHYFSSIETPGYAHSHLLTAIYSPDYVDVTGNGPSDDDFGYFVKFNYSKATTGDYKWRSPLTGANLIRGNYSNQDDNKGAYMYGEKEIYYLNSVETKTHIAVFTLSNREDGFGVNNEAQLTAVSTYSTLPACLDVTKPLKKLDKITLYSKADRVNPVKTVNFEYDYSLCGNTLNNNGSFVTDTYNGTSANLNAKHGKLTLKKVWFSYLNNKKGKLSPYIFNYNETNLGENPDYNLGQMDRWGNYKPDNFFDVLSYESGNEDFPYTTQRPQAGTGNRTTANDVEAGVWSLKTINLPSGGIIRVDYESDDYAYVQDRKTMQMMEVVGTGAYYSSTAHEFGSTDKNRLDNISGDQTNLVYFKLEEDLSSDMNKLKKYFEGIDLMYFKVFTRLKDKMGSSGLPAYDYVDGYAMVDRSDPNSYCGFSSTAGIAWVKVDFVPVRQSDNNGGKVHPFRKAAFEYMKLERADLLYAANPNPLGNGTVIISTLQTILQDVGSLLTGFYANCVLRGYAKKMLLDKNHAEYRPSFIRLNTPDGYKLGGGHRVKRIRMDDNWQTLSQADTDGNGSLDYSEASFEYGQEFRYNTFDYNHPGELISSGVAEYEPIVGGNENPFRMPSDRYSNRSQRLFHSNLKELYIEEPIGESYFPPAGVGYSRVTVRNLSHPDPDGGPGDELNDLTGTGAVVHEFYTAKDFPVVVDHTDLEEKSFTPPEIHIPFIGNQGLGYETFSQGYKIELNDMHGKLKSMSSYSNEINSDLNPLLYSSRVTNYYSTVEEYSPNRSSGHGNRLNNLVNVLDADATYRMALLGQTSDFFIDMMEHSDFSITGGIGINTDYTTGSPVLFASLWPSLDFEAEKVQTVVTNKIINKNGILVKVVSEKDGVKASTESLMFDSKTGNPLLTSNYNNFDAPVYNYSFAGHWAYQGMEPSYKNYRRAMIPSNSTATAGVASILAYPENNFLVGDMVEISGDYYWVDQVTPGATGSIHLIDEDGTAISPSVTIAKITVMKTFRTNQQGIPNGTIVSLSNPVTDRRFPLFDALNYESANNGDLTSLDITKCNGEQLTVNVSLSFSGGSSILSFNNSGNECPGTLTMPFLISTLSDLQSYNFTLLGNGSVFIGHRVSSLTWTGTFTESNNCYAACIDNVLHADATRFDDTWTFDYTDADVPAADITLVQSYNNWRAGKAGVWRGESSNLYKVKRKQTSPHTDIAKDGTYEHFTLYNWKATLGQNNLWTKTNEMTKYNPYGFEMENTDAIGVYSSALYGYNGTSVTAVTANGAYYETGFNSFESTAGNGHLALFNASNSLPAGIVTTDAHTGKQSANGVVLRTAFIPTVLSGAIGSANAFSLEAGKQYTVSAWMQVAAGSTPGISAKIVPSNVAISGDLRVAAQPIEGWYRVDFDFIAPSSSQLVQISFYAAGSGGIVIDDLRVMPFKSAIQTFVYDPVTLWLVAELDNRNYATFYNYDEEGNVVQMKKETEKGIMTIRTSRNNIQRN